MNRISAILLLLSLSGIAAAVEMCHEQQGNGRLVPCDSAKPEPVVKKKKREEDELCLFMPLPDGECPSHSQKRPQKERR